MTGVAHAIAGAKTVVAAFVAEFGREDRLGPPYSSLGGSSRSSLLLEMPRSLLRGDLLESGLGIE